MEAKHQIPDTTIETLARNFFKEASSYGFKQDDYLRFINVLLDFSMRPQNGELANANVETQQENKEEFVEGAELPIEGKRVKIRAFEPAYDKGLLEKWLAEKYGRYFLLSRTGAQILNIDQFIDNDLNIIGVIALLDETPIGIMAYLDFDLAQRKAELRKLIGEPKMRAKGFGKEATRLWIHYGITGLELQKIYLNTLNTNIRNIKLNEELGFKVEGILRNETLIDGEYHDVLRMGLWNGFLAD